MCISGFNCAANTFCFRSYKHVRTELREDVILLALIYLKKITEDERSPKIQQVAKNIPNSFFVPRATERFSRLRGKTAKCGPLCLKSKRAEGAESKGNLGELNLEALSRFLKYIYRGYK